MRLILDGIEKDIYVGIVSEERTGDPAKTMVVSVNEMTATSVAIDSQVPEFVRHDHPKFVQFLKSYYDWMEIKNNTTHNTKRIRQYSDIDSSSEQFEDELHKQFLVNIPKTILASKPQVLKNIRDFYRAKGTEKSFKFFFRAMYDSPAEFYYPRTDILKLSDGKYIRQKSIKVRLLTGQASLIQNSIVVGQTSGTSAYVDVCKTIETQDGIFYELFLNKSSISGNFVANEVILIKDNQQNVLVSSKVLPVIKSVEFITDTETNRPKTGLGYQYGDSFVINTSSGKMGLIAVSSIAENGSLKALTIKDFGLNYSEQPFLADLNVDIANTPEKFSLSCDSFDVQLRVEDSVCVLTISGFRNDTEVKTILQHFVTNSTVKLISNSGTATYKIDQQINFYNKKLIFYLTSESVFLSQDFVASLKRIDSVVGSGATVRISTGVFCDYPGYYVSNNGQLNETKYIQDGEFYQQFSYVVYTKESAETYRTYLKDMIHPLGLKFYGGLRDPVLVEGKAKTPPNEFVTLKMQQYPRRTLFPDVPVPRLCLMRRHAEGDETILRENIDYTILPKGNSAPYNSFHFSIKLFNTSQPGEYILLFRNFQNKLTIKSISTTQGQNTFPLPFEISPIRYEDVVIPHTIDLKTPMFNKPSFFEKSPALDGIKHVTKTTYIKTSSFRTFESFPLGASLKSVYRERFRYSPAENMTQDLTVLDGSWDSYWGNSQSPGFQYANTQIAHFKHMIPKCLDYGDVPDMLIVKNGRILKDNVDYIIVGKNNNPWSRPYYCIRLLNLDVSSNVPANLDTFEVIFRDVSARRIITKRLTHNSGASANHDVIEIPHPISMLRPECRINIMPDAVIRRGILVEAILE